MSLSIKAKRAASLGLMAATALAPLPLASNRDWAWSPLALLLAAALLTYALHLVSPKNAAPRQLRPLAFPIFAMTVVVGWALLQMWFLPHGTGSGVTGGELDALRRQDGVAIDDERLLTGLMRLLTYCGVFWLASQLGRDRKFADRMCWVVIGSAVVVTASGYFMQLGYQACFVFGLKKTGDICTFSGTFVNSGNYATYAGLAGLVCAARLQGLIQQVDRRRSGARDRWRLLLADLSGRGGLLVAALILLTCGILFSMSRAGFAAFIAATAVMAASMTVLRRHSQGRLIWPLLTVFTFSIAILLIAGEQTIERLHALAISSGDPDRLALFSMAASAVTLRPWTGWGLGSFDGVFSILQPATLATPFDKAHNLYLETAMELGVPVASLLILAVVFLAARCLYGISIRGRDAEYPALGFGATVLVGLHSLVDFGLQIPAVAVLYSALLGIAWAQSWTTNQS
jgi:hypothetical protein